MLQRACLHHFTTSGKRILSKKAHLNPNISLQYPLSNIPPFLLPLFQLRSPASQKAVSSQPFKSPKLLQDLFNHNFLGAQYHSFHPCQDFLLSFLDLQRKTSLFPIVNEFSFPLPFPSPSPPPPLPPFQATT